MAEHLIEFRNIKKRYGSVDALGGVDLYVDKAEVLGLIGDNGAGKSTLIKILAGVVKPTSGEISVRGSPVYGWNAARSREVGIETVFQDQALALQQSIIDNVFMGRELVGMFGWLKAKRQFAEADRLMREIGFTSKAFTPHSIVGQLSGGERQGVAIARAMYKQVDLIVLDEPTTALSLTETAKVFHYVRQVRASGHSIIFIDHSIHHVFDIADRFAVLDRGKIVLETDRSEVKSVQELIGFMEHVAHPATDVQLPRRGSRWASALTDQADKSPPRSPTGEDSEVEKGWRQFSGQWLRRFVFEHRAALGTLAVFLVMMSIFVAANPAVFTTWSIYSSVLTTLPVALFVVVPLVFVVAGGEIDLSFPAVMGFASWAFALLVQAGFDPLIAMVAAILTGLVLGFCIGMLVVYAGLSSLIATLGMNFLLRGLIQIVNEGRSIALVTLGNSLSYKLFSSVILDVPVQILWAVGFVIFATLLYNRHRFGAHVKAVGDNPDSARQMGINVKRVRVRLFVFMGVGAAIGGTFSTMINLTWWPTAGDGYLLPVLTSVFVGGTPAWGGVGTVMGGAIGALTVASIQTGVVAAGLSGFYVQFFYGLIIILSLLGHRWNQIRYR
ncbi:ABC transporter permease subunit [Rhizobium grahamii]|uniref:Inner-membrane translocator n=1 Tax=Rhizobium grahamii CCGE 502 TaxID=990285 RepID=S3IAV3_9HYPH|nr:ATP-binding cassette domain-containing protein [Rhizobium grahamii]EPE96398.1 inner-membrane translocator [Rhizobium grahamii CCGE 502]